MGEFIVLVVCVGLILWCFWPMISFYRNQQG